MHSNFEALYHRDRSPGSRQKRFREKLRSEVPELRAAELAPDRTVNVVWLVNRGLAPTRLSRRPAAVHVERVAI
jgi:hypothetical protein